MKTVQKKTLDNLIRLSHKYWETGDVDILDARIRTADALSFDVFGNVLEAFSIIDFVDSCIKLNNKIISNETIYAAFGVIGIEVGKQAEGGTDEAT